MKRGLGLALAALMILLGGCAQKPYPAKGITLIVPYGAGGTADIVGRRLAAGMSAALGQTVAVVNQAGASGSLGCKTVLDAEPDGYTLLLAADSLATQRVMGISQMSYNDFTPILVAANDPKVIVVGKDSPYQTAKELFDDMIARPGKVRMSHTGPGGSGHVQGLVYEKFGAVPAMTGYNSGSECIVAVLGGQVDFTNSNLSTLTGYLQSGDLRMLAVASDGIRLPEFPDVPALSELYPEMSDYLQLPFSPLSLMVRGDTPAEVVETLRSAAAAAVAGEDWNSFAEQNSLDKLYEQYPDEAAAREFYASFESAVSWLLYDAGAAKISPAEFDIPMPE